MKIKDEEIDLKITPRGIQKVEEKYKAGKENNKKEVICCHAGGE